MKYQKEQLLRVKNTSPSHAGRKGYFQFFGGPEADCVVMTEEPAGTNPRTYFAVGLDDVEECLD